MHIDIDITQRDITTALTLADINALTDGETLTIRDGYMGPSGAYFVIILRSGETWTVLDIAGGHAQTSTLRMALRSAVLFVENVIEDDADTATEWTAARAHMRHLAAEYRVDIEAAIAQCQQAGHEENR